MRVVFLSLWCFFLCCGTSCSKVCVMQRSESMEAYRMDEETKRMFVETNPIKASFSVLLGPINNGRCDAYAKFRGFGERKDYLLFCLNTGDAHAPIAMHTLTIEDDCIIDHDNGVEVKKNAFELRIPAIPGFQSTWYLWAEDNSVRLSQKTIAKSLQTVGSDGATLTLIRKESGGNFVEAHASGLHEGEQVCFILRSLGEQFYHPEKVPESGKLHMPFVSSIVGIERGVISGSTTISLVRKHETLDVTYDWDLSTTQQAAKKSR